MDKVLRGIAFAPWVLILMVTTWSGPAFAEPDQSLMHSERHGSNPGHDFVGHSLRGRLRHAKELGLSEEQVTKLKTLWAEYEKAKIRGEAEMQLAEVEVQALAHDEKAELSAIENAIRKAELAHANLRIEGMKALRAAAAVLTPEQRDKWRAIRAMRHGEGTGGYGGGTHEGKPDVPKAGAQ